MKLIRTLLVVALASVSFAASAQWLWIDRDGHKVFSDRSPPPDILEKNILRRPGGPKPVVAAPADADSDAAPAAAAVSAPSLPASGAKTGGVDKDLEAKKKLAKDAEIAKRKAAEEQFNKDRAENCTRAKAAKISYDRGDRISRTNAAGEKEILDDAARAQEVKRVQSVIDKDCK